MDKVVKSYFDPSEPGSFAGASTYRRHHPGIKYSKLAEILSEYRGYTLHKPIRKRFQRNKTIVGGIDAQWDIDLADVSLLADKNDGFKFWLCLVDVFSKKAWVQPLRSKKAPDVVAAFEKVFDRTIRRPRVIRSDKGGEFKNKSLREFLKKHNIDYFTSQNEEIHASIAERFIRTIKSKAYRYFHHNRTDRYVEVLEKLVSSYNDTYHRSIGMSPNKVTKTQEPEIWSRLYGASPLSSQKYKFNIGDQVRIADQHAAFKKGYEGGWSEDVFKISERLPRNPPVYRIVAWDDEEIIGTFYEKELQKISITDDVFSVEKVIRQRRRNGKTEYFVKWLGYPAKYNSWIDTLL